jgi:hypothetical protein
MQCWRTLSFFVLRKCLAQLLGVEKSYSPSTQGLEFTVSQPGWHSEILLFLFCFFKLRIFTPISYIGSRNCFSFFFFTFSYFTITKINPAWNFFEKFSTGLREGVRNCVYVCMGRGGGSLCLSASSAALEACDHDYVLDQLCSSFFSWANSAYCLNRAWLIPRTVLHYLHWNVSDWKKYF